MAKGDSDFDWQEKHPDTVQSQPEKKPDNKDSSGKRDSGENGCKKCCMSTKNCLMSPECGRCLNIASVVSMCGMCIRMWTCELAAKYCHLCSHQGSRVKSKRFSGSP
ncbi:hypothetical protein DPEC_G00358700 [Dallia pectoralis]|uniref:Uncharacterized protein n=1 Tax=Dallia pectoralis TaxID=75939 RepID=A0ACC2F0H1_DALPE|nr:hypothetical protein DPEC_G00358700 [Dallia pectoralis]